METRWPGEPQQVWDRVDHDGSDLWVPDPYDLPAWDSPKDLLRTYLIAPVWWQRAILLIIIMFASPLVFLGAAGRFDWDSYGTFKRVLTVSLGLIVVAGVVTAIVHYVYTELRWLRAKSEILQAVSEQLTADPIPIWGLLVGKVRLGDRISGVNDAPDDFQFMFDLRVPRETLQRQRAVATAWVDAVADAYPRTNYPQDLGLAFNGRSAVHCADVFGEQMRGVWMWRKGSVLPREVLGLAFADPRDAEDFTDKDVVFIRRTSRDLIRRSRIAKR